MDYNDMTAQIHSNKQIYNILTYEFKPSGKLEKKGNSKNPLYLYITAFLACLIMITSGFEIIWIGVQLPKLQSNDTNINPLGYSINSVQQSWISSLSLLGAGIGPWISSKTTDKYGRRKMLFLIITVMLSSFLILTWASNINIFYLGRFVGGIGMGLCYSVLPMYIIELCDDHNRGMFASGLVLFNIFGIFYGLVVGPFLSIKMYSLSCTIPLIVALVFSTKFLPETPSFLVTLGRKEEALAILKKIRNKNNLDVEKDYLKMFKEVQENSNKSGFIGLFRSKEARKGLLICMSLCLLEQFCGICSIMSFIWPIFESSGTGISTYLSTVLVGVLQIISLAISTAIIDKLGRKFLLLSSSIGLSVALILLGLYFYLKNAGFSELVGNLFWLPLACVLSFIFFYFLGMGSIPFVLIGEILSPNFRSLAYSICSSTSAFSGFLMTAIFPLINEWFGEAISFWIYACLTTVGVIFIKILVPETKGMPSNAIQKMLSKK